MVEPPRENYIYAYHQRFEPEAHNYRPGCLFESCFHRTYRYVKMLKKTRQPAATDNGGWRLYTEFFVCMGSSKWNTFFADSCADVYVFPANATKKRVLSTGSLNPTNGFEIIDFAPYN